MVKWRSNERKKIEQEEALLQIEEGRHSDRKIYEEFRLLKLKSGHLRSKGVFTGNHSEARTILGRVIHTDLVSLFTIKI